MRYNDMRNGTKVVDAVLGKYTKALKDKDMIRDDGLFVNSYRVNQAKNVPADDVGFTAWFELFT
jgi:hypothetical protein